MNIGRDPARGLTLLAFSALALVAWADDKPTAAQPTKSKVLTDRDRAILAALDKPALLKFKDAPLGQVLDFIKTATRGAHDAGIVIELDADGMKLAGMTAASRVSFDSDADASLKRSLGTLLGRNGLTYKVENGTLVITANMRGSKVVHLLDHDQQTRAILAKLEKPVELHFKNTPLDDVLKFVKKATEDPDGKAIAIYVDPVGLLEAERTIASPVSIEAKGEPLASSMKRMLKPLGLTYAVKDGLLTVTSLNTEDEDLDVKSNPGVKSK